MTKLLVICLKVARKLCFKIGFTAHRPVEIDKDANSVSNKIAELLLNKNPVMIARFGSAELNAVVNYLGMNLPSEKRSYLGYIQNTTPPWWWENKRISELGTNAGFFPTDIKSVERFSELFLEDIKMLDLLGSWRPEEIIIEDFFVQCEKVEFELLNPYFGSNPWTKALAGKKILVVHPFAKTIEQQYIKRELLFQDNLLPAFELKTIKAIQSIAGNATGFANWFEALDFMKAEIDNEDYDICLIGAGAYGFSLAAHVKRRGKKAFHLGGSLQLLFGIRGKRWENPNYNTIYNYSRLMNEHWVKPNESEKPGNASVVEGACYW
jgi:hypothetical protein